MGFISADPSARLHTGKAEASRPLYTDGLAGSSWMPHARTLHGVRVAWGPLGHQLRASHHPRLQRKGYRVMLHTSSCCCVGVPRSVWRPLLHQAQLQMFVLTQALRSARPWITTGYRRG